jgi:hypothetical protein
MEERCAVVSSEKGALVVSFFNVVVYVDDVETVTRHERSEVHLVADPKAGRVAIYVVGPDGKSEFLTSSTTSH